MGEVDTILVSPGRDATRAMEKGGNSPTIPGVSFFRTEMDGRKYRMAIVAQSEETALAVFDRSVSLSDAGIASPKGVRSLAQQGVFMQREDLPAAPLAFVFPGQGSQYGGMGRDLYASFPVIKEWMDRAAALADFDLLHLLFHDREENLQKTRWQQPALFAMEYAMARHLTTLGLYPVAMAGHSLGELTALCLAGVYSAEDGFRIVNQRALCMDKAAAMHVEPGVMAAVDAPLELLKEMIRERGDAHIGNINSPNQVVLSGSTEAVKDLCKRLKGMGHRATLLRVSMAFHSPIMRVIHDELEAFIDSIPFHSPRIPVISNTTMAPYPSDPGEIRRILMAHLESPVHWMNNVQTLWDDYGARLFVEVGPGETLSNLIADTLPESVCIPTCLPAAESLTCKTALAQLFVQGHLAVEGEPKFIPVSAVGETPDSTPVILQQTSPAAGEATEHQDLMERLIGIIMAATGFNRDEVKPDMDLRKDLSIRSSRLPIIMDAAERQFGITIELEDFIDVRTVTDIAQRISRIIARQGGPGLQPTPMTVDPDPVREGALKPAEDEASLKRLVLNYSAVNLAASVPVQLSPGESVLLLSPDREDGIAMRAGDILRLDYGVATSPMRYMREAFEPDKEGHDIRTDEGAAQAADRITGRSPLAGVVITLDQGGSGRLKSMADVSRLLRGLFLLLQAFLQSPAKKFVVLVHSREDTGDLGQLLAEGMLGLFLSAAQEHPSVQFRTLEIDRDTDLRVALRGALDRGCTVVETIHRDEKVLTSEGRFAPSVYRDSSRLELSAGDVVVMSGGATGISAHLARCLVPFKPRLVFLGRTLLAPGTHPATPCPGPSASESCPVESRAGEIARTLAELHSAGIEATYHTCDVTDPEAVRAIMGEVAARYGKIDGIIHGAGVLRDGPLSQMTPDDFSLVMDVKFLGAWNLFSAAQGTGLRFFVGLSSAAAIQGNPGQANYAAANRMMSALLRTLRVKNDGIRFKALMLPPVEGAGMAEDPQVRELMKRKGVAYIHVNELAGLFCRELFVAPADDDWVIFMRRLPSVRTALLDDTTRPSPSEELDGGTVSLSTEDFPMIDRISWLDIRREELEAFRSFSPEKDLWITDHRPFKFVKHPLVSAAMVLETFMEAARILYPHLQVRGVRQVQLMDMIQCPPGVPRPSRISCRRASNGLREVVCEVSLAAQELYPGGRLADRFTAHCKGQVILDGGNGNGGSPGGVLPDFPVRQDELRTKPMDHKNVRKLYKDRSRLEGRYRVLEFLDGAGPGVVRGRSTCRQTRDFANLQNTRYQYSPYLFEALLQLVGFHIAATDPSERRSMIPVEIGEMRFLRKSRAGEQIALEARMRAQDDQGLTWDARGLDDQGRPIMQIRSMRLQWVSE
jgi:malonyl CoA-acyl carrier protein transacylase